MPPPRRRPQGGKLADPAFRHERAMRAGAAARRLYLQRSLERADGFPSKAAAYTAGYRTGYHRAMAWWKQRVKRYLATLDQKK